jgi:hypothetical protein
VPCPAHRCAVHVAPVVPFRAWASGGRPGWVWHSREDPPMRGKQVLYTALIALGVVVGFQSYQAKKG